MSIEKLPYHYSMQNLPTIYDEEALTALELAARTTGKVNECVDNFNALRAQTEDTMGKQNTAIQKMNDETMPAKVEQEFKANMENGEFDTMIDKYAGNLEARMDSLLGSVTPGSTTMDAEVIDIRTGADNKAYTSAGTAVRKQFELANKKIGKIGAGANMADINSFNKGYGYYSNGNYFEEGTVYSSDPIPCKANTVYSCRGVGHVSVWDNQNNFLHGFVVLGDNPVPYGHTFNSGDNADHIIVSCYFNPPVDFFSLVEGDIIPGVVEYVNTVKDSALDAQQMERKRFVDMLMKNKNAIPVTWALGGMDAYGEDASTENGAITNYFTVPSVATRFFVKTGQEHFVVGYDDNKAKIWGMSNWSEDGATTEIPNACAYYRIYTTLDKWLNVPYAPNNAEIYYLDEVSGKLPYQTGYIPFTVAVNQKLPSTSEGVEMANVSCVLRLPPNYTENGTPAKLLMVCHGAGRGITGTDNWTEQASYNALITTFTNAGYAVFDCNGYNDTVQGQNFWGCHRGLEGYRKAYDYVVKNYNVETAVNIYGFSMGGLTALNLMFQRFPNIKTVACGSPVTSLKDEGVDNGNTIIYEAYGMTEGVYDENLTRGCDPTKRIMTVNGEAIILDNLPPVKIWYGSREDGTETTVNKAYAQALVNAMRSGNNIAWYREVENAGHEICYGANATVNGEIVVWLNRFNA